MVRREVIVAGTLGVILAATSLAYLVLHPRTGALTAVLGIEVVFGREVSIPAALAAGFDWQTATIVVSLIELTSIFALFPLLVGIAAGLHKVRWLEDHLRRAQDYARRNPDVDVLALGALTFMPFLPVGALTAILIGELLRVPSRYLLPVLAGAVLIANILTAYAAARLMSIFPDPKLVAVLMTVVLLLGAGIAWLVHRRAGTPAATEK